MKEFQIYYYDLHILGKVIDKENAISNISKHLIGSIEGYKIEKVGAAKFFITIAQRQNFEVLPKKGDGKNVSIDKLKPIGLGDDEELFSDIFIYLDFGSADIFGNSLGVVSVLKGGKEASISILNKFFNKVLELKNSCSLNPIPYKDPERYLKNKAINSYSFSVASAEKQQQIGESGGLTQLKDLKDEIGGNDIKIVVTDKEGLDKNKVFGFQRNFSHLFKNSASITVDEVGHKVQQKIDSIRFKSIVAIELENKELKSEKVLLKMQENYILEIPKIRTEYEI